MRPSLVPLLALALTAPACTGGPGGPEEGDPEDGVFIEDGKADDFLSTTASEFKVVGKSTVTIERSLANATPAAKEKRVRELIAGKQVAIAWFLTEYLIDKEDKDKNAGYGGMGGMAKGGAWEDLAVRAVDATTYEFTFRQLLAGDKNLMSVLPVYREAGRTYFDLEIGKPTNEELGQLETNGEWYRNEPWDSWNPATAPLAQKEKLALEITRETKSEDAWFDMPKLIADGVLDVDVHFGWDYHSAYHVKHAKALFTWLVDEGYTPPVAKFDQLTRTSGPFTRQLLHRGAPIDVRVQIFYGKTGSDTDPDTDAGGRQLEADVRKSLAERDVILYSGHSGPFYGFALANWKKTSEGDLDDDDMRTVPMPANRYQVVVAEGCDTYQVGQAFKDNPAKQGKNVDVITTTSFSNAATPATVQDILLALTAHDTKDELRPRTAGNLLKSLDSYSADEGFHTMYGLHGIDDNPTLHPFAVRPNFGKSCSKNSDCGGPGNLCVTQGRQKACTAACSADSGCGDGFTCKMVASGNAIYGRACAKR